MTLKLVEAWCVLCGFRFEDTEPATVLRDEHYCDRCMHRAPKAAA